MHANMAKLPEADLKRVVWMTEVYEPSDDSFALVDAVHAWLQQLDPQHAQLPGMCLEVGCGSGYVICSIALALQHIYSQHPQDNQQQQPQLPGPADALQQQQQRRHQSTQEQQLKTVQSLKCRSTAGDQQHMQQLPPNQQQHPCRQQRGCKLIATDINPAALTAAAQTLDYHGVHDVELVQADLVAGLMPRLAGTVDLLLFNPPYVPTPDEEVLCDGIARAWAGGHLGRRVTDRLLPQLPELLSPNGHAFIVTVPENKPQEIITILGEIGLLAEVVLTRSADEECLQILHIHR